MIHSLHAVQKVSVGNTWNIRGLMLSSMCPFHAYVSQLRAKITLGMAFSVTVIFMASLQSTVLTRSVGTFAYHLAQLILFGELAA